MTFSILMTACSSEKEAAKISDALLKKKLAACVKLSRVKSSYWWNGKITKNNETLLTILTAKKNSSKLMGFIKKAHSYKVPEIIEIRVSKGDKKYLRWASGVTE